MHLDDVARRLRIELPYRWSHSSRRLTTSPARRTQGSIRPYSRRGEATVCPPCWTCQAPGVHGQLADAEHRALGAVGAAEESTYPGAQLGEGERLDQVVVRPQAPVPGPGPPTMSLADRMRMCVVFPRSPAASAGSSRPSMPGQHQVEDDPRRRCSPWPTSEPLGAVGRHVDGHTPLPAQPAGQPAAEALGVLDEQESHGWRPARIPEDPAGRSQTRSASRWRGGRIRQVSPARASRAWVYRAFSSGTTMNGVGVPAVSSGNGRGEGALRDEHRISLPFEGDRPDVGEPVQGEPIQRHRHGDHGGGRPPPPW